MTRTLLSPIVAAVATVVATTAAPALPGCRHVARDASERREAPAAPGAVQGEASVAERNDVDAGDDERQTEREALVAMLAHRGIASERVLAALRAVPRHRFIPATYRAAAYEDRALPISHGQTISQPYVVAYMTELLGLDEGERVLEVGTGSGYQAAVLAELSDEVFSIEIIGALSAAAGRALADNGYGRVRLRVGDGYAGWVEHAPFDAIIITAAAPRVPEPLVEQLAPGGRMVLPVEGAASMQWIWIVEKAEDGIVTRRRTIPVRFVDMTGEVDEPTP